MSKWEDEMEKRRKEEIPTLISMFVFVVLLLWVIL